MRKTVKRLLLSMVTASLVILSFSFTAQASELSKKVDEYVMGHGNFIEVRPVKGINDPQIKEGSIELPFLDEHQEELFRQFLEAGGTVRNYYIDGKSDEEINMKIEKLKEETNSKILASMGEPAIQPYNVLCLFGHSWPSKADRFIDAVAHHIVPSNGIHNNCYQIYYYEYRCTRSGCTATEVRTTQVPILSCQN